MNDQYCYQTSKKMRQVFDMKRRNGDYVAPFAPLGDIKDPKDKHKTGAKGLTLLLLFSYTK